MRVLNHPTPTALLLISLALCFPCAAADDQEAFWEAARQGDLAAMKRLHAAGVDVNASTEYGATALSFAADKGKIDVVRWLIEQKADVNNQDTFYEVTPLGWALYKEHVDVALLLMASGAEGADQALGAGVRMKSEALVAAALGSDEIDADDVARALEQARGLDDGAEIVALLEKAEVNPSERPVASPGEASASADPGPADAPAASDRAETAPEAVTRTDAPARLAPRNWPQFRGPGGSGVADGQGAVELWDVATGENVRWKTPIPGLANSSPIVWGDRVFVTTAISGAGDTTFRTGLYGDVDSAEDLSEHVFKLYALSKRTGKLEWEREVARAVPKAKRHLKSTQANSTPVTDGKRVVVLFGTIGLLAAYDMNGQPLWTTDVGVLDAGWFYDRSYQWGHASSPVIHGDLVIVQADIYAGSFIAAYRLSDGKQVWKTSRDDVPSWGTPTIHRSGEREELIANGKTIRGYDPRTGKELWSLTPNSEVTVATPVAAHGLVYVTGGYPPARPVYAIRPGGRGDLTLAEGTTSSDHIAWSQKRGGTYMPTPVVYGDLLYTCNNDGRMTVYEAKTGEQVYRARVGGGGSFTASPVAADGRLYFANEDGDVVVVRAGPSYGELGKHAMGEVCMATPAISNGLIVIRTLGHVYGIGQPAAVSP